MATLPPISTSVARLMPSTSECRQPYLLSNFDFVTESLTLIAGNSSAPAWAISYSRCTPVVVSSLTPRISSVIAVHRPGCSASDRRGTSRMTFHSSGSSSAADGTAPAFSYSAPLCTSMVASPPSSRIRFGPGSPGQVSACSVHHQYSSSVSPFQANTGMPRGFSTVPSGPTATAAAAWSWVEKMLQLHQRTSAPLKSFATAVGVIADMINPPVRSGERPCCREAERGGSDSVAALLGRPRRYHTGRGCSEGCQPRLEFVQGLHRPRGDTSEGRQVDRDQVAQQDQREDPLDRRLPAGLQPEARHRVTGDHPLGQVHPLLDTRVGIRVVEEDGREAADFVGALPSGQLVVVELGQIVVEARLLGVLVDLRLPAVGDRARQAGSCDHRGRPEQAPGDLLGERVLGRVGAPFGDQLLQMRGGHVDLGGQPGTGAAEGGDLERSDDHVGDGCPRLEACRQRYHRDAVRTGHLGELPAGCDDRPLGPQCPGRLVAGQGLLGLP